ncbi:MAG: J domain-containing protein [Rhodospirillales bacterium]|nr:J domain-containing protein [Rhodospirillales bacterium]
MRNLYDILGIPTQASASDIKSAFRKLARDKHPDANSGTRKAEDDFKELNRAYGILSDPDQRTLYDRGEIDELGTTVRSGRQQRSSPFEDFIRRRRHPQPGEGRTIRIHGADVSYTLRIKFMDAVHGATTHVSMTNGKRLRVTIPPGTRHEQTLRLKGQGMGGVGGGNDGDALVEILVDDHDLFIVDGDNIVVDLPVSLSEAVLGGPIEAPSVDGPVKVTVPANANTGTTLRLRGKGLAKANGQRGDQMIRIQVMLPDKGDPELTKFVRSWKAGETQKPRKASQKDN